MTQQGNPDKALLEVSLRLAWYVHKFGPIPEPDMLWLAKTVMASQFGHGLTGDQREVLELARQIRESFLTAP